MNAFCDCQIMVVFVFCFMIAGARASTEPWKHEIVKDIAESGRGVWGVVTQWEGQRGTVGKAEASSRWYRDSIWFAEDGRYRISFGAIGGTTEASRTILSDYVTPSQVPFNQGNMRTAEGTLVVLMPSRQRILAGQTDGNETASAGFINQLALNPSGLAWWIGANVDDAERGIFQVEKDQFGFELPHYGMRCFLQKLSDSSWMVRKIERLDTDGVRTRLYEFDAPIRLSQGRISVGRIRTLKVERPIAIAGKQIAGADQTWYLVNLFAGVIPDNVFNLSDGGLVTVPVKPAPKDRIARLNDQTNQNLAAGKSAASQEKHDPWLYFRVAGVVGFLFIGAVVIRKRTITA